MPRTVFTPDNPVLPMYYPGFVFRTLREEGLTAEALLADTGLDECRLNDPHFRCGFHPLRRLFLNAIEQTGDPNLGINLALKFQPSNIGLPAYAAICAAHLADAIAVLLNYFSLNFPALELHFLDDQSGLREGEAAIRLRAKFPFEDIEYFGFSSAIIAINGLLNALLKVEQACTRAEMTISKPQSWYAIETKLALPFRFEATENQLIFPSALLNTPLPGADPLNHMLLMSVCERFKSDIAVGMTPISQVISVLESATSLTLSFSNVAKELGYSERSLRRQLERCGTSYRKLLDQVREQRARKLLSVNMQSVKTITSILGFESSSNFARSFKRWTGLSPKAYRARKLIENGDGQK